MAHRTIGFISILLMALALVPAGAHLFALPNKIGLDRDAYFTVQGIYAGWSLFGIVLFGALFVNLVHAIMLRGERPAFVFALIAFLAVVINLAIFFAFTFPANQATENWTNAPADWEALRRSWEYSHAVNAVVMLAGFIFATLAVMSVRD